MATRDIQLRVLTHVSNARAHSYAENPLKCGEYVAEIFKIGSQITNMLENASQSIACYFDASQEL